jgi:hypothetical protein
MDNRILISLRNMAWERAKGELKSILETYWGNEDDQFDKINDKINNFIKDVEDNW